MVNRYVALFSGGSWHDFATFETYAARWVEHSGLGQLRSLEPDALGRVAELGCALAMMYTCFDEHTELDHSDAELHALTSWVRGGGRLFALHASAVAARRHPPLADLLGGQFLSHPPKGLFEVAPSAPDDPWSGDLGPIEIDDERYELELGGPVRVHLTTRVGDAVLPLAWSRSEGQGKVGYLALGHDESSWRLPVYETLVMRALAALV